MAWPQAAWTGGQESTAGRQGEREWCELGGRLARRRSELVGQGSMHMWEIGDWLAEGEDRVFRRMKRVKVRELAAGVTGYSLHTLRMAVAVARRVHPDIRVDGLTWWHHLAVAWQDPPGQSHWLTRAAEEGWSAEQLRERLRAAGLVGRARSRSRVQRLIGEVVKLSRDEIPEDMVHTLGRWWQTLRSTTDSSSAV
jgi:hypothetical protein